MTHLPDLGLNVDHEALTRISKMLLGPSYTVRKYRVMVFDSETYEYKASSFYEGGSTGLLQAYANFVEEIQNHSKCFVVLMDLKTRGELDRHTPTIQPTRRLP